MFDIKEASTIRVVAYALFLYEAANGIITRFQRAHAEAVEKHGKRPEKFEFTGNVSEFIACQNFKLCESALRGFIDEAKIVGHELEKRRQDHIAILTETCERFHENPDVYTVTLIGMVENAERDLARHLESALYVYSNGEGVF